MSDSKVAKIAKLAANPYAQPEVRMQQMQRLLDEGSESAMRGVLKRFAANASSPIADEDEKKWLEDALVDVGSSALPALRDYIRGEKQLTYALRAFRRISGSADAARFFIETLEAYGPEDYRAGEAKLQLVWQLSELIDDATVLAALIPFLHDHNDDIRLAVMDLLEKAIEKNILGASTIQEAVAHLGQIVGKDGGGPRVQRRACELLEAKGWALPESVEGLALFLDDDFFIDKKRFVRRRAKQPDK